MEFLIRATDGTGHILYRTSEIGAFTKAVSKGIVKLAGLCIAYRVRNPVFKEMPYNGMAKGSIVTVTTYFTKGSGVFNNTLHYMVDTYIPIPVPTKQNLT